MSIENGHRKQLLIESKEMQFDKRNGGKHKSSTIPLRGGKSNRLERTRLSQEITIFSSSGSDIYCTKGKHTCGDRERERERDELEITAGGTEKHAGPKRNNHKGTLPERQSSPVQMHIETVETSALPQLHIGTCTRQCCARTKPQQRPTHSPPPRLSQLHKPSKRGTQNLVILSAPSNESLQPLKTIARYCTCQPDTTLATNPARVPTIFDTSDCAQVYRRTSHYPAESFFISEGKAYVPS
jgi:hypothetical protein